MKRDVLQNILKVGVGRSIDEVSFVSDEHLVNHPILSTLENFYITKKKNPERERENFFSPNRSG